jgi:hypothetical protein
MVTDLDETRLSTVMGSSCATKAQLSLKELQDLVRADSELEEALAEDPVNPSRVRKSIRGICDEYCRRISLRTLEIAREAYLVEVIRPMAHKAAQVQV